MEGQRKDRPMMSQTGTAA